MSSVRTPQKICSHFGPCGGCSFLDQSYAAQLEEKRRFVESNFQSFPELRKVEISPVQGDPFPFFYRNKAIYPFGRAGAKTMAGFYRRGSHSLVDIHECQIQDPSLTEMANRIREIAAKERVPIYNEHTGKGFLRSMVLRVGMRSGEMMVGLVTTGGIFPPANRIAAKIVDAGKGLRTRENVEVKVVSVMRNIQNAKSNVILGPKSLPLRGQDHFFDKLGKLRFRISLPSFYQINSFQAAAAYQLAVTLAGDAAKGRVVDAYSGIGTISLWFATQAKEVIGLEEVLEAVRDAQFNSQLNKLNNTHFEVGPVERTLEKLPGKVDLLVVDPPRAGCAERTLEAIAKRKPPKFVYISCAADTLARDLSVLVKKGFKIDAVRPIDFFPHTDHVEIVSALSSI